MTNIIPITQKELYKQFLKSRKEALQAELAEVEIALNNANTEPSHTIVSASSSDEIEIYENGYIPKWTYPRKIRFILELKKKALTARQITDIIINEVEAIIWVNKSKKEKDALFSTLSSTLTNNSKPGKEFIKSKNEIDENIYSLK